MEYQEGQLALGHVDFCLPEHSIYTMIGPSGCGKSTLLRAIAGLVESYTGDIWFNDQSLREQGTALIGFVPQNYGLLPWKTVQSNIRMAMRISDSGRQTKQQQDQQIMDWLAAMGIAELAQRYPCLLVGGNSKGLRLLEHLLFYLKLCCSMNPSPRWMLLHVKRFRPFS